jgi:hypothetical protein
LSPHFENEEYDACPGKKNDGDEDALATLIEMERLGWLRKDAQEHRPNRQHVYSCFSFWFGSGLHQSVSLS